MRSVSYRDSVSGSCARDVAPDVRGEPVIRTVQAHRTQSDASHAGNNVDDDTTFLSACALNRTTASWRSMYCPYFFKLMCPALPTMAQLSNLRLHPTPQPPRRPSPPAAHACDGGLALGLLLEV